MSVVLTCLLILFIYIVYSILIKPGQYWQSRGVFYVKPWTRFFKVFLSPKSFSELIRDSYNEFPNLRYYGSYQFMTPSLFVRDLDLIKQITIKDFDHFTDHVAFTSEKVDPIMGANLFALKGERWKRMRSTLSPAFTSSKMKSMFLLIQETAENFVDHFSKKNEDVVVLEMKDAFAKFTNDVIATCAFGIKCDSLQNEDNEFYRMGKEVSSNRATRSLRNLFVALFPKVCEFFRISLLPEYISGFFRRMVKDTITEREQKNIIRPDMIHLLMQARKGNLTDDTSDKDVKDSFAAVEEFSSTTTPKYILTDEEITAQALVFFFAGYETASTVTSFLAYELALQPDLQKKLQSEIDDATEQAGGKITYEDILKMKYLDQVISEALRKWPPGFALNRICVKDYHIKTEENEKPILIEKGCLVLIPVFGIHMDEKYFPQPQKFDPDRFSDANKSNIVPGSFMPFGTGPRNCIGSRFAILEMKTLIFYVLSKFDVVVIEKTKIPLELSKTISLAAKGGVWLGLKKRCLI